MFVDSSKYKIHWLYKMTTEDVVKQCYRIFLDDRSSWVNLSDGYFMNPETGINSHISNLYPSIKLGINFNGVLVCKRKNFRPKIIDGEKYTDYPELKKVAIIKKKNQNHKYKSA